MTLTLVPEKTGVWVLHEVLTHDQVNKIASELVKAVDGVGGGVYTISIGDLEFTGSSTFILDLAAQLTSGKTFAIDGALALSASGRMNLASGAGINVNAGASINVAGGASLALSAGASLTLASTATVASTLGAQITGSVNLAGEIVAVNGGLLTLQDGARINVQAQTSGIGVAFAHQEDLAIANRASLFRLSLTPVWIEHSSGNPYWTDTTGAFTGTWVQRDVGGQRILRFAVPVRPGDSLSVLQANLAGAGAGGGGHSTLPSTGGHLPTMTLYSVSPTGVRANQGSVTDSSASTGIYDAAHVLTLSLGPYLMTPDPLFVEITGESGPNAVANSLRLNSINGVGVATVYRPLQEVYP